MQVSVLPGRVTGSLKPIMAQVLNKSMDKLDDWNARPIKKIDKLSYRTHVQGSLVWQVSERGVVSCYLKLHVKNFKFQARKLLGNRISKHCWVKQREITMFDAIYGKHDLSSFSVINVFQNDPQVTVDHCRFSL